MRFAEIKAYVSRFCKAVEEKNITAWAEKLYKRIDRKIAAYVGMGAGAAVLALVLGVNFSFAYNAFLGDTELGYVPNKEYVEQSIKGINDEFAMYVSGEEVIEDEAVYVPAIIKRGAYTDVKELEENIKSTSYIMAEAYAVEIDGKAFAALESKSDAESILKGISEAFKTDEDTEIKFKEDVEVVWEYVPMTAILSAEQAEERLKGYKMVYSAERAKGGMLLADFALSVNADADDIAGANPDLGKFVDGGAEIIVPRVQPVITVMAYDTVSYETTLPYDEKVSKDALMYEGAEKIIQKGADGVSAVTERIERTNGDVTDKKVVKSVVKSEPVQQLRAIGTKERPQHMGTGTFLRPYQGTISSRFGSRRSGNHTGVDFCGNVGDPIIAADSGTVIFSGWSGGYGKIVKIDHNNGYISYYAHCNDLYVNEGDIVQKGDTIAALGNTGNSTGPHVHFEIHHNDAVENPMNYVD